MGQPKIINDALGKLYNGRRLARNQSGDKNGAYKLHIMNILNFMQRFPDETSCISYLKEQREQSGVICKHCGGPEHRRYTHKLSFRIKARKTFRNSRTSQNASHTRPELGDNGTIHLIV